jgi:uncharacterized membrane protein YadS
MTIIGWIVMAAVAYASMWISRLIVIRGSNPLEAMMVGIILGAIARNVGLIPPKWKASLKKFETPLLWGIVLLGAGFSLKIARDLPLSLVVILVTMFIGYFFIYFLGKKLGLSKRICALLAAGTTICGGSAIAIISPLIKAREEETSYSVSTIVIAAFIMLLTLPFLGESWICPKLPLAFGPGHQFTTRLKRLQQVTFLERMRARSRRWLSSAGTCS